MRKSTDCPVCRLIRFYLLLVVPLIAILGLNSLGSGSGPNEAKPMWFARVELIDFLAWGALFSLLCIFIYRAYMEFWVPRRRKVVLEKLLRGIDNEPREF